MTASKKGTREGAKGSEREIREAGGDAPTDPVKGSQALAGRQSAQTSSIGVYPSSSSKIPDEPRPKTPLGDDKAERERDGGAYLGDFGV